MSEKPEFIEKYYVMDPETEDITLGRDLRTGMKITVANPDMRAGEKDIASGKWGLYKATVRNRWFTVKNLRVRKSLDEPDAYLFVGVYEDGTKHMWTTHGDEVFLFKKDSYGTQEDRIKAAELLILKLLNAQAQALLNSNDDQGDILLMARKTADEIAKIF